MNIPSSRPPTQTSTTKQAGDAAEGEAQRYLQKQGLRLLHRNYRSPGRGGGEIDLFMGTPDGTTVFVEVRSRTSSAHGGAAASISYFKQAALFLPPATT